MARPPFAWSVHGAVTAAIALAIVPAILAQAEVPPTGAAAAPSAQAAATPQRPAPSQPAEGYTYDPEGRRDPFVSLIARGADPRPSGRHTEGLSGLSVAEVAVKGILQSREGFVAMVQGPDLKTYIVHRNDRLLDGTVRAITAQTVIIMQDVTDPFAPVKQREVRKGLRALDEGK